jgi:hypothetical protein
MAKSKEKTPVLPTSLDTLVEYCDSHDLGDEWEKMPEAAFDINIQKEKIMNPCTSLPEETRQKLAVHFLAELLRATAQAENQADFQQTLQAYCDNLRPWLEPNDCPPHPRANFSLLEHYTMDATGEQVTVVFSPEAEAFFRAWLRRVTVLLDAGVLNPHGWAN